MKKKRIVFLILLLSVIFGLLPSKLQVYAQDGSDQAEATATQSEDNDERVDATPRASEASKESEGQAPEDTSSSAEVSALTEDATAAEPAESSENHSESLENTTEQEAPESALENTEDAAPFTLTRDSRATNAIYLDGVKCDDDNDGLSRETALKTFAKAKEIASLQPEIESIYVLGTVSVEGEVSLENTNARLVRDEMFSGYLLRVASGKEATVKNITIDGGAENNADLNKNIEKSLIEVQKGATLNIQDGALLCNNPIKQIKNTVTRGGAVYANTATVNMTGGTVEENQATYGGGIYLYRSTLHFSGGIVQKNRSERLYDTDVYQYYAAGAGIIASEGSTIYLSGSATVSENISAEVGGGISIGSNEWEATSTLYMNGGVIENNIAGSAGGGLFIQAKLYYGGPGRAYINAGTIINNIMTNTGMTNSAFGGGGIYVNGANDSYGLQGANGELYLTNTLITENHAAYDGGGIANCPISKTTIYLHDGAALYGNTADRGSDDLYILSSWAYGTHSGEAEYQLPEYMLGGAPFHWTDLNGEVLAKDKYAGTLPANSELALNVDSEGNDLTQALAQVTISGNVSNTRGGGIGSNGTVVIGTEGDTTEVSVEKKWQDNDNEKNTRPDSITVQLIATYEGKDYLVETREVTEEDDWKTTFTNLVTVGAEDQTSDGSAITYSVKEVDVEGYESSVTGSQEEGFTITNTEKPKEPSTREIAVQKIWDLIGDAKPVDRIEVELYRDGNPTGNTLVLNEENNWSGVFSDLEVASEDDPSKEFVYTVQEIGEQQGQIQLGETTFEVTYAGDMDQGLTITNKETPDLPPEPPKTPPNTPNVPNETDNGKPEPPTPSHEEQAPKTNDLGVGLYLALVATSMFGFGVIGRKKD